MLKSCPGCPTPLRPQHQRLSDTNSMKCLNNRADSHLSGQVECEMDGLGNGAWVNQGFCGTLPPIPRAVSTIYNPQPHFQGPMDNIYKLDPLGPFPEVPPSPDPKLEKKQRGCCSFIKGRRPFSISILNYFFNESVYSQSIVNDINLTGDVSGYSGRVIMIKGFLLYCYRKMSAHALLYVR